MQQGAEERILIGIFTTDADLVVQVWDDAMCTLTGLNASAAVGKNLTELIPEIADQGLLPRFERVLRLGTNEVLSTAFHRYLVRCAPRSPSPYFTEMQQLVTVSPLRSGEQISGIIVLVEDVTERMDRERDVSGRLKDPDDKVRLEAAKEIARGSGPLSAQGTEDVIGALGDRNWRVRRKLVEGLSKRIAPEAVSSLLSAFRDGHLDFGLLNSALQVLQAASPDTAELLVGFLRSEDSDLRIQAALALGELENPAIVPNLLQALHDKDTNVRYHAIEALGKLRARDAVRQLLSIAETRDFFLAFPALEALANIGGDGIAERVSPLLDDEALSGAACATLGAAGGIEIVEPVISRLERGKITAASAAISLCGLARRAGPQTDEISRRINQFIGPRGKRQVAAALSSASGPTARELVRMAGWIEDPAIRERLADLIGNTHLHDEAVEALTAHGEVAINSFVEKLASEDPKTRMSAARALGEFDSPLAVQGLISALGSDEETAAAAVQSLGRSGSQEGLDPLIGLLSNGSKTLKRHAVQSLKSIAKAETAPRLCALLDRQRDAAVREALVRIIGGLDTKECEAVIVAACKDENAKVRSAAVQQLINFPLQVALPLLEKTLKDDDSRVRSASARALGHIGGPEPVEILRAALSDSDAWTRYFAVRALGPLKDPESEELIKKLAEHDEAEQVRAAAAEAVSGQ